MKTTVVHIIESLGRGGAEILFVNYINALPANFRNIIVYLRLPHTLLEGLHNAEEVFCLDFVNKYDIIKSAIKLCRIIHEYDVKIVHSHLYWPTIVARVATIGRIPLIFSNHNLLSQDAFKPNILSKYLEKASYSKNQTAVFVSHAAYKDYQQHINLSGRAEVIYNFVGDVFFSKAAAKHSLTAAGLKLVAVGNLKPQKNHLFLLKCLKLLNRYNITLDIYGEGHQKESLEEYISEHQMQNVRLMGSKPNIEHVLKAYDVFVLASRYEGFCIAMAEAMAVGLPCVVTDIEVLKEVSGDRQLYFEQNNENSFIEKVMSLYNNKRLLKQYSVAAKNVAERYTVAAHMQQLLKLYKAVLR